jgi:hypothetical protein
MVALRFSEEVGGHQTLRKVPGYMELAVLAHTAAAQAVLARLES